MKILLTIILICLCASFAMADELVPPFTKIKGIVERYGNETNKDNKIFTCSTSLPKYLGLKCIDVILAENKNVGIAAFNNKGDWKVIYYDYSSTFYAQKEKRGEEILGPIAISRERAVGIADALFKVIYEAKCLPCEQEVSKPQNMSYNKVWCCCESYYGGLCCAWVDVCLGVYIPGCVCK